MAPITCRALDSLGRGLPGMRVFLQCYDAPDAVPIRFLSYTDKGGVVEMWFPVPSRSEDDEPEFVDVNGHPQVSIIYDPASYFGKDKFPRTTIRADLNLIGKVQHDTTLQFGTNNLNYKLRHKSQPLSNFLLEEPDPDLSNKPNVKSLPSISGEENFKKRKAAFGDAGLPPRKKRRIE